MKRLTKECTGCHKVKPLEDFHIDNHLKSGRHSRCKKCILERDRIYRQNNQEKIKARQLAWREQHREEARERTRQWYLENTEKAKEWQREYRKTPQGQAQLRMMRIKRRKLSSETDIDGAFLEKLLAEATHCPFCNDEYDMSDPLGPKYRTLDHIIPLGIGGTHTQGNVRYMCRDCNNHRPRIYIERESH